MIGPQTILSVAVNKYTLTFSVISPDSAECYLSTLPLTSIPESLLPDLHSSTDHLFDKLTQKLTIFVGSAPRTMILMQMRKRWPSIFINSECSTFDAFRIRGRQITFTGESRWTHLLGSTPVTSGDHFSFKIRTMMPRGWMAIGLIDCARHSDKDVNFWDDKHAISYGNGGHLMGDAKGWIKTEGTGYSDGDTVTVQANIEKGEIKWMVNGSEQACYSMGGLRDEQVRWVPLLRMVATGQRVEWLE